MSAGSRLGGTVRTLLIALALSTALVGCTAPRPLPGLPAQVAPARLALPARLQAPTLGLSARIGPVGLADSGDMEVPGSAAEVGWYELGPRPGERGNAVLVGHNVWNGQPGAFAQLGQLRAGDRITVATSMGAHYVYVVERVQTYRTDAAPIGEIFAASADPVLTLITCAGRPDARGEYPDRLVVRARAVAP